MAGRAGSVQAPQAPTPARAADLQPTSHPPVPSDPSRLWLVPGAGWRPSPAEGGAALRELAEGASLIAKEQFAQALPRVSAPALATTILADYAIYLRGLAEQGLNHLDVARRAFAGLRAKKPAGALLELATLREAECAEGLGDFAGAVTLYETLTGQKTSAPDEVLAQLAHAAQQAGDKARAIAAYERLYYEFPLSDQVVQVPADLGPSALEPMAAGNARFKLELARGEALFGARRYAQARDSFALVQPFSALDQREVVDLRIAECDHFLRRYQAARDELRPLVDSASRRAEARFFWLSATRGLGNIDEYVVLVRRLVDEFPASPWAEEALNNLASYYIVANDDETADGVFREMIARFPSGRYASRAGWKAGWWAFKHGRYDDAAKVFEQTATSFPRGDLRPSVLYWAGKAREHLNDGGAAVDRYRLVVADYANTYYGRLAATALQARKAEIPRPRAAGLRVAGAQEEPARVPPIPTEAVIRVLVGIGAYDLALEEVRYAEREWGSTPALAATRAWLLNRKGELRPAINLMRQAYPQFMTLGGDALPPDLLKVIFPVNYWPLIRQVLGGARPGSLAHRGADRAGVDVRPLGTIGRQRDRDDADCAGHRATLRRQAGHQGLLGHETHQSRDQRPDRHGVLRRDGASLRRNALRPGGLQRGRVPRDAVDGRAAGLEPGRVHRRHPVSRDAELHQAHSRHRRGLSPTLQPVRPGGCPG